MQKKKTLAAHFGPKPKVNERKKRTKIKVAHVLNVGVVAVAVAVVPWSLWREISKF